MPVTLARRLVAILLLAIGMPVKQAVELTGLCERRMWTLQKEVREKPAAELLVIKKGSGRKRKCAGIEEAIVAEVETNNYHTRQQIADMIEEKFQVKISCSAVGQLLKKNGIRWLKSGSLPAKADPVKQEEFYHATLHPLMEQAENGAVSLLFLDASHFVMGCDFLGRIYGRTRRFVKTFSGRKRYNILGAMDYVSKKVLSVANDSYITASEVCDMLRKIATEYGEEKKVCLILDNARYQKCKVVEQLAGQLHIQLVYIPPYSPNLNLIERLWKFVKGELRSKYYDDFDIFQNKILSIITSTDGMNKSKMDRLIGKGVQLFHNLSPLCSNTLA